MKKSALILTAICLTFALQAQNITTMWPYKYSDFETVRSTS